MLCKARAPPPGPFLRSSRSRAPCPSTAGFSGTSCAAAPNNSWRPPPPLPSGGLNGYHHPLATQAGKASVLALSELKRVLSLTEPAKILLKLSVSSPIKTPKVKEATHFFPLSLGHLNPYPPQGLSKNSSNKPMSSYLQHGGLKLQQSLSRAHSVQSRAAWSTMGPRCYPATGPGPGWSWAEVSQTLPHCAKEVLP